MVDQYWPPQHSEAEQMRIMHDLQISKKQAFVDNDEERLRNLTGLRFSHE